jgi:hypothetical protein
MLAESDADSAARLREVGSPDTVGKADGKPEQIPAQKSGNHLQKAAGDILLMSLGMANEESEGAPVSVGDAESVAHA